jgi:hypothetical protein
MLEPKDVAQLAQVREIFGAIERMCIRYQTSRWRVISFATLRFQRTTHLDEFPITVLKVSAGHPQGRASLADLRRAVGILISSGPDWNNRTKRLAARAPHLDLSTGQCGLAKILAELSGFPRNTGTLTAITDQEPEAIVVLVPMPALPVTSRLIGLNPRRPRGPGEWFAISLVPHNIRLLLTRHQPR